LIYFFLLFAVGLIVFLAVPAGGMIVISITFAVIILNYQKNQQMHKDIRDIKNHFDLLKGNEKEEYDIDQQLNEYDKLDEESLEIINKQIEDELEGTLSEEEDKEKR